MMTDIGNVRRGRRTAFLTMTERRVADCLARGMSNKEIAAELGMSPSTVKSHVLEIMRKTGAQDRHGVPAALTLAVPPMAHIDPRIISERLCDLRRLHTLLTRLINVYEGYLNADRAADSAS